MTIRFLQTQFQGLDHIWRPSVRFSIDMLKLARSQGVGLGEAVHGGGQELEIALKVVEEP